MKRIALVLVALVLAPAAARGQIDSTSTLGIAVRLATEGQGDSARALVRTELRGASPSDTIYPYILFAAGVVAQHLDSARTYFRRVSIEYSGSALADDALLRLAQLAFGAGDYAAAARTARRVLLDFPLSHRHAEAAYWAGRAELEQGNLPAACEQLAAAEAAATNEVELLNRIRYFRQRCTAATGVGVSADTGAAPQPGDAAGERAPTYAVQVAAVSGVVQADQVMRSLHAQGYESRVVRDPDGLWKVRVGRFRQRADAERLARELEQRLGGQPFVVEEQP